MSSEPEAIYKSKYMTITRYGNPEDPKIELPSQEEIQSAIEKTRCRVYRFSICETTDKKYNMLIRYGILAEECKRGTWTVVNRVDDVTDNLLFAEELARRCNEKHIFPHEIKDELKKLRCEEILFRL